jgi:hypothetical protein
MIDSYIRNMQTTCRLNVDHLNLGAQIQESKFVLIYFVVTHKYIHTGGISPEKQQKAKQSRL